MTTVYRFGAIEVNPATRQVLIDHQPVPIAARAYDVLIALIERRDRVVAKSELLDLVWPRLVVEENNLQVQVSALRKLLGADAIATVAGRGYRFTLEPTSAAELAAPASKAGLLSIMVLPLLNLTGEPSQAYVADGLTASLTSDLSRIRDAFIVNAATAFTYKNKPTTAQQLGEELGVRFVLHGGVQCSGTKFRVNVQLADTTSNAQLWSDSFEGDQSDLFALQDRVTTLVGNSIGREMVIVAARTSETRKSNATVADLLLRARAMTLRPLSLEILHEIENLCRQAVALEPNNARAMVELANSVLYQADNFSHNMDKSTQDKKFVEARDLALRVREIDPDNPGIYPAIAGYAASRGDWEGALRAAETRLLLQPKNPYAYNEVAVYHYYAGEPERSINLLMQAINLNPKHPADLMLVGLGRAHFMLGDNDAAIGWLLKSLEQNAAFPQTHAYLAMAYVFKGDDVKARDATAEVRRLAPTLKLSELAPDPSGPDAYKALFESKLAPAWRKAGLPE